MIKGKKGWLRIIEAFIAIMLIAGFLLFMVARGRGIDKSGEIYEIQRALLEAIERNDSLRFKIITAGSLPTSIFAYEVDDKITSFIRDNLPSSLDFEAVICDIDMTCGMIEYPDIGGEIYVDEILISTTLTEYPDKLKKLKLFVWEK